MINSDPAVYPYNVSQIYPTMTVAQSSHSSKSQAPIVVRLPAHYPTFELCNSSFTVSNFYTNAVLSRSSGLSVQCHADLPHGDGRPIGYS
jgi:hypothetical protein